MKRYWILFCSILILIVVLLAVQMRVHFLPNDSPQGMDLRHTTNLFDDVEESKHYQLEFLYKYPHTNYIILHFHTHERIGFLGGQLSTVYTHKLFWIDESSGKRVLSVEYQDYENTATAQSWWYSYNRVSNPVFLRMDDEVVLITDQNSQSGINYGKNPGWMASLYSITNTRESNQFGIRPNGERIDIPHLQHLRPIFGTNHFMMYHEPSFQTMLYTLTQNEVQLTAVWDKFFLSSYAMQLDERTFYAHSFSQGTSVPQSDNFFLVHDDPPKTIPTGFHEHTRAIHSTVKNISMGRSKGSAMIAVQFPGSHYAVYEVAFNEMAQQDTVSSVYKKVYEYKNNPPFAAVNQNQVLLLSDANPKFTNPNQKTNVLSRDRKLFYSIRQSNDDGEPGGFEANLQPIVMPEELSGVSVYPYDDTHLLMYGNNAIWTMKWDGTELQQIFPAVE